MNGTTVEASNEIASPRLEISHLAPEIIAQILNRARYMTRRQAFISCLLVCRQWYQIGLPFAWSSVCLDNDSMYLFVQPTTQVWRLGSHIKSLTLRLDISQFIKIESRPYGVANLDFDMAKMSTWTLNTVEEIAECIKASMSNLASFSLHVDNYLPEGYPFGSYRENLYVTSLRDLHISKLLEALPKSCSELELDTRGMEVQEPDDRRVGSLHLCPIIRSLLPRLRHLRLRVDTLCSELLLASNTSHVHEIEAPALVSLSINLNHVVPFITQEACETTHQHALTDASLRPTLTQIGNGLVPDPHPYWGYDKRELLLGLGNILVQAHKAGTFPKARRIQVMDLLGSRGMVPVTHFALLDIIKDRTYELPFRRLFNGESERLENLLIVARNKSDREFFGRWTEIEPILEDSVWVETVEGDRWTKSFKYSREEYDFASVREPRYEYESRKEYLRQYQDEFPAWAAKLWKQAQPCRSKSRKNLTGYVGL